MNMVMRIKLKKCEIITQNVKSSCITMFFVILFTEGVPKTQKANKDKENIKEINCESIIKT